MKSRLKPLGMLVCLLFIFASPAPAPTEVVPHPDGSVTEITTTREGTTEVTKNADGETVKTVEKDAEGRTTETEANDPETGKTVTTKFKNGKPVKRETTNKDDSGTEETLGKDGRVTEARAFDEEGTVTSTTQYKYDKKGRVKSIKTSNGERKLTDETTIGHHRDGTRTLTHYHYDENGRRTETGHVEIDKDGHVVSTGGDITGITAGTGIKMGNPNQHVYKDSAGNTVIETHNADGSVDVIHIDPNGQRFNPQHFANGCSFGSDCPFGHLKHKQAGTHEDINYRDPDLFVDPADIFDRNENGEKDPWQRARAAVEIFDQNATVSGRYPDSGPDDH